MFNNFEVAMIMIFQNVYAIGIELIWLFLIASILRKIMSKKVFYGVTLASIAGGTLLGGYIYSVFIADSILSGQVAEICSISQGCMIGLLVPSISMLIMRIVLKVRERFKDYSTC